MWRTVASRQFHVGLRIVPKASTAGSRLPQNAVRVFSTTVTVTKSTASKPSKEAVTIKQIPDVKPLEMPDQEKELELMKLNDEIRTHHKHGHYEQALDFSLQLLEETGDHFGKEHPATASAYNNVGLMHKLLGDYSASHTHYHEALGIYERVLGRDHASFAAALHNIGNLQRSQVHMDESLSVSERVQLNEQAIGNFEEAWNIRKAELGEAHPYTVASRSDLGSTIASHILQQQSSQPTETSAPNESSKLSHMRWEVAEEHLRLALDVSIQNPRGNKMKTNKSSQKILTLSAASAAQNLAYFLKIRAVVEQPKNEDALAEAKRWYEQVLVVRTHFLQDEHPDTVATKFSLAELLTVVGDEDGANALRTEIMNSYDVTEADEPSEEKK